MLPMSNTRLPEQPRVQQTTKVLKKKKVTLFSRDKFRCFLPPYRNLQGPPGQTSPLSALKEIKSLDYLTTLLSRYLRISPISQLKPAGNTSEHQVKGGCILQVRVSVGEESSGLVQTLHLNVLH